MPFLSPVKFYSAFAQLGALKSLISLSCLPATITENENSKADAKTKLAHTVPMIISGLCGKRDGLRLVCGTSGILPHWVGSPIFPVEGERESLVSHSDFTDSSTSSFPLATERHHIWLKLPQFLGVANLPPLSGSSAQDFCCCPLT